MVIHRPSREYLVPALAVISLLAACGFVSSQNEFRGIGKQSNSGPQIISAERPDLGVITV